MLMRLRSIKSAKGVGTFSLFGLLEKAQTVKSFLPSKGLEFKKQHKLLKSWSRPWDTEPPEELLAKIIIIQKATRVCSAPMDSPLPPNGLSQYSSG